MTTSNEQITSEARALVDDDTLTPVTFINKYLI